MHPLEKYSPLSYRWEANPRRLLESFRFLDSALGEETEDFPVVSCLVQTWSEIVFWVRGPQSADVEADVLISRGEVLVAVIPRFHRFGPRQRVSCFAQ